MGQIAHPAQPRRRARAPRALAVMCVGVLGSPLLTGCGGSLASATTTLAGIRNAAVVHADGTAVPAVDGLRLRAGDVVRTAADGRAELRTRGRVVYEGSDAAVQVLDGARSDLRHGAVVVDSQHGPGLSLTVAGLQVSAHAGSALRAERSVTVRIAALAGGTDVVSVTGRHLDVGALTQAVIGGDALPDSTASTPLRLIDDDGEARSVPSLVRDDLALNQLAAGIDSTGDDTARVVTAAWHTGRLAALPTGVARSEQLLPVVIAAASGGDTMSHYDAAVDLRKRGASWGVVAHRLGTTSSAVLAALQAFEKGAATGQVGSVPAALAYLASVASGPTAHGNGTGGGSNGGGRSPNGGGSSGSPQPTTSSSGSPDPVGGTIDTVLKLLPTPLPTVSPTSLLPVQIPTTVAPVPVPSVPTLPVGGLLTPAPSALLPH